MKRQLIKAFIFSIPMVVFMVFIVVIDPHEFVNIIHVIPAEKKIEAINRNDESGPRGNMLWKSVHFKRNPVQNILIGDSQCREVDENFLLELTGQPWFNFCVPGASYQTMFDNFWFAAEKIKLNKVYFEVSFMNYNQDRSYSISHFASDYLENPYLYFTKKEIFFDAWINMRYAITGNRAIVEDPHVTAPPDEMDILASERLNLFFNSYIYPDSIFIGLSEIADYCHQNDIELVFIIMPTYMQVRKHLEEIELWGEYMRFKDDIASLSKLIDYDTEMPISYQRQNFTDYFHSRKYLLDEITLEIWGKTPLRAGVKTSGF